MNQIHTSDQTESPRRATLSVEECADILGICSSAAYALANAAVATSTPFAVIRIGRRLLISRKSFTLYLETNGF